MRPRLRGGMATVAVGAAWFLATCWTGGCSTVLGIGDWTNLTDGGGLDSTPGESSSEKGGGGDAEPEQSGSADGSAVAASDSSGSSGSSSGSASGSGSGSSRVDSGSGGSTAPFDAGSDGLEAGRDAGPAPPIGPTCGPRGATVRCYASQVCCENLAAQTNSCSASCASNATLPCSTASDCPTSAPICCAEMTLVPDSMNDLPPKCANTALFASCAASCNDNPPSDATTCKYPASGTTGMVRLCSHNADCASDTATTGGGCFDFNGAPVAWCSTALTGLQGVQQP